VEVTISLELEKFNDAAERLLRYGLAGFLEVPVELVKVIEKKKGSTKIHLTIPSEKALQLEAAFRIRDPRLAASVHPLEIVAIRNVPETPNGTDTIMMAGSFEYDAFIAYAHQDAEYAEHIHKLLSVSGKRVFLDKMLFPGDLWTEKLEQAQKDSLLTIVLLSAHSDSAFFQKEEILRAVELARGKRHRVVPVYLTGKSPSDRVPSELRQIQSIFLEQDQSLLKIALQIEAAIEVSRQREDWQSDIDSATIVIVTGCHHRPELFDRPLAYQLKQAIDEEGGKVNRAFLRSVVMGDIWFNERSGFADHSNIISIGSPSVNPLTQQIIEQAGNVQADERWRVMRGGNRWALFGNEAEDTRAAVKWFKNHQLAAFLEEVWSASR